MMMPPFGGGLLGGMLGGLMGGMMAGGGAGDNNGVGVQPQVYSYSSSTVMRSGPDGVYHSSTTSRHAPGGVSECVRVEFDAAARQVQVVCARRLSV